MFPSPVPAYSVSGAEWAIASAPIASDTSLSDVGLQFVPPFVVFQTPPRALARYMVAGEVGCTTISVTRPLTSTRAPPYVCPRKIAFGPSGSQLLPPGLAGEPSRLSRAAVRPSTRSAARLF